MTPTVGAIRGQSPQQRRADHCPVDYHYSKDRTHVFFTRIVMDGVPQTGEARTIPLPDADPATFVVLENGYARSGSREYLHGVPVQPAR